MADLRSDSPVERFDALGARIGVELLVKRDDFLPFPLAGNKVRKIQAELDSLETTPDVVITNGSVDSNHCRTLAVFAARRGFHAHLVLHGHRAGAERSLEMLTALGASFEIVEPSEIRDSIACSQQQYEGSGKSTFVLAGGCHTPAGAIAYRDAAEMVIDEFHPDLIVVASGTGATQGGIAAGAAASRTKVVGVSVAREAERGEAAVREAALWAGMPLRRPITFTADYREGGYGQWGPVTQAAVRLGWSFGLPLDLTYTGKAFAGLLDMVSTGAVPGGSRVLFWHTGGLWNAVSAGIHREELRAG